MWWRAGRQAEGLATAAGGGGTGDVTLRRRAALERRAGGETSNGSGMRASRGCTGSAENGGMESYPCILHAGFGMRGASDWWSRRLDVENGIEVIGTACSTNRF